MVKSKKSKKKVNKKPRKVIHLDNPFEHEKSSQVVDSRPYIEELCVAGGESRYNVDWLISMLTVMKEI